MKYTILIILVSCFYIQAYTQNNITDTFEFPPILLEEVKINPKPMSAYEQTKVYLIKKKILKVYPYYLLAKELHQHLSEKEKNLNHRLYKKYKRTTQRQLKGTFTKELKSLYVSEGKILVKLINREFDKPLFDLIVDLKGKTTAQIYQMVAKINGYDLKAPYNPNKERIMELAISALSKEDLENITPINWFSD